MKENKKIIILLIVALLAIGGVILIQKLNTTDKQYLQEINYKELKEKIDNNETFALLIKQDDCPYCEMFFPTFEKAVNKNKVENAYYINTSSLKAEDSELFQELIDYDGTPTTVFFDKGTEMNRWTRIDGNKNSKYVVDRLTRLGYIKEE